MTDCPYDEFDALKRNHNRKPETPAKHINREPWTWEQDRYIWKLASDGFVVWAITARMTQDHPSWRRTDSAISKRVKQLRTSPPPSTPPIHDPAAIAAARAAVREQRRAALAASRALRHNDNASHVRFVPVTVLEQRAVNLDTIATMSDIDRMMGTPPPGRSALDLQRVAHAKAEAKRSEVEARRREAEATRQQREAERQARETPHPLAELVLEHAAPRHADKLVGSHPASPQFVGAKGEE